MNTAQVAKKHQELRDAEIAKKIKESIAFLDNEELKHALLNRILKAYEPKLERITKLLEQTLHAEIERMSVAKIEDLINKNLESVFNNKLEEKIAKMIDDELDRRFDQLIKNYDREDY